MHRRYLIHNPSFSEFVYRYLTKVSEQQMKFLDDDERKIFASEKNIHYFCENSPKEKIDLLLTKLGIPWVQMYGPNEEAISHGLFASFNQWEYPQKRLDAIEVIAKEGVFVTGSAELMLAAQMTAQNCSTKVYHINQFAIDLQKRIGGFNKMRSIADDYADGAQAYTDFSRLVLEQLNSFDWALQELNLTQNEIRILLSLFTNRTSAKTLTDIAEGTRVGGAKAYLKKHLEELLKKKMVVGDDKQPGKLKKSHTYYMLTSLGVREVTRYVEHLHKITFKK